MSKASEAVSGLLADAKSRQRDIADKLAAAERQLVRRRADKAAVDAEVRELEAALSATQRARLTVVNE